MNMLSNKKKIRGLKKYRKILSQWKNSILLNSEFNLSKHDRWYEKQIIDPFYRLTRRQPPFWIQLIQLENLIEIGLTWKEFYKRSNIDGRIFLWVYPDVFIQSQIVAVKNEMKSFYDETFEPSERNHPVNPGFKNIFDKHGIKIKSKYDVNYLDEDDYFEYENRLKTHLIGIIEHDDIKTYALKGDNVFVCEL